MRRYYILVAAMLVSGILAPVSASLAQSPVFLSVIEDLPLMPGFVENTDAALKFETEAGRIAEITASGPGTASAVVEFYSRTLPQLGWHLETPRRYQREDETLILEIIDLDQNGAGVEVHFQISPVAVK